MNDAQSVEAAVREMIAQVLSLEPEEVRPESRFFADLGGESIELLELQFKCEKHWGVAIPLQGAFPARLETDAAGRPTAAALAELRAKAPFADVDALAAGPRPDLRDLLTVRAIAAAVGRHLNATAMS